MNRIYLFCAMIFILASCKPDTTSSTRVKLNEKSVKNIELKQIWETPATLQTAESVLLHKAKGQYIVSCIGDVPPNAADGDGYLALIDQQGNVINEKWTRGLDAPKGMGIRGSELFVTDINKLVIVDLNTGRIKSKIPIIDAEFLNDVAVSPGRDVFFSDSNTNKIYQFKDGKVFLFLEAAQLGGSNGLFVDEENIYVAGFANGDFHSINRKTKKITKHGKAVVSGGDGVEPWKDGMIVSNWNGEVYYMDANWTPNKVLDTKADGANAADIFVNQQSKQLLVPTFFKNSVVAYSISNRN